MLSPIFTEGVIIQYIRTVRRHQPKSLHFFQKTVIMKLKGNSIERRIEIARASIERNKDRKQRREKAEAKLQNLLQLKEEVEREQAEKEEWRSESKKRKKEYMHWYWINVKKPNCLYIRDEDLYTKEELMNPPEGEAGRLTDRFWELIEEAKRKLFQV